MEHIDSGEPDLEMLKHELDLCLKDTGIYLDQYLADYKTRFCLWEGQDRSGRKWDAKFGGAGKARPWDGASDVRTFTADDIVNEQVDDMLLAWWRSDIQVTSIKSTDVEWSTRVTGLLQWLFKTHLAYDLNVQLELAAQWRQTYGIAAVGIWWDQQKRIGREEISMQELIQNAQQMAQQTGNMQALKAVQQLVDPVQESLMVEKLMELSPILDKQGARKVLRDLRSKGTAELPQAYVFRNQPRWEALRVFLDVFFPVETTCLKDARIVTRRRWFTETELANKVETEQWDEDWVTEALTHKGVAYSVTEGMRELAPKLTRLSLTPIDSMPNADHYVEVFDSTYLGIDEDSGMPVLQRTIWTPHVMDGYARHEPMPYDHGEQPYVDLVRERIESQAVESRSVCEIATTRQASIKTQEDAANDYAQMTTIPTLITPLWRSGSRLQIGPAAQIAERTQNELRFLNVPQFPPISMEVASNAKLELAKYFARANPEVAPQRTQSGKARLIGTWLMECGQAMRQSFQLCQQYLDEVQVEQQIGPLRVPFHATREQIQGEFNILLHFESGDLNFEQAIKKMEAIQKYLLPMDTVGAIDRAKLTMLGLRSIDPYLAMEVAGTPQMANQGEADDEKRNLAMILSGVEPPMRPEGQNYQLRLQTLMGAIQQNPIIPQIAQQRPDVNAMLNARIQHLKFMAEQFGPNAQIGRMGAQPGLQSLQEEQQASPGASAGGPGAGAPGIGGARPGVPALAQ